MREEEKRDGRGEERIEEDRRGRRRDSVLRNRDIASNMFFSLAVSN